MGAAGHAAGTTGAWRATDAASHGRYSQGVREAIEDSPTSSAARREAGRALLAAERIPVPDPAALKRELEEIRGGSA